MKQPREQVIHDLREQLSRMESGRPRAKAEIVISTGMEAMDRMFPQGGLAAGTLVEWVSGGEASGAASLALVLAGRIQEQGGAVVVIDERREFYPPAAQALGITLARTMVVQPAQARDALWAWEQTLRSSAVAIACGRLDKLNDRVFRRLQTAAVAGGSLGFLLRPLTCRREPSWAEARFLVEPLPGRGLSPGRRLRVELLHARGAFGGKSLELELSDEAGDVRLVPSVAHSASAQRAARA